MLGAGTADGMLWRARHTTRVLLVSEPPGRPLYRLREALDEARFGFRFCPGPGRRPCPVLLGEPCPVRGRPAAALIYQGDEADPIPPCGRALGIPAISVRRGASAGDRETAIEPVERQAYLIEVVRTLAGR